VSVNKIKPFSVFLGSDISFDVHGDESIGVEIGSMYVALSPEELQIFLIELAAGYRVSAE